MLNATDDDLADDRMADRLAKLGFRIVAVEESLSRFPETKVFYANAGARDAAEALADKFDWVAAQQPADLNLSLTVDLHVLVGDDAG